MKCRYLILTALFAGCVLAVQAAAADTAADTAAETAVEPNRPMPKISFDQTSHNFGNVSPAKENICKFKFTNTGNKLLKIKKVHASCGCIAAELSKKEYAPDESGSIEITFRAPKRQGTTTKRIYVHSNDKKNPKVTLTVKARVVMKVTYEPEQLKLSLKEENAGCPKITLKGLDKQPFSIKSFKSTADCITADVNCTANATEFVIKPKVALDKLRENLNGRIKIELTHPECKTVTIRFTTPPRFQITPATIILFKAEPQKPVTKEIWILANYDEDFEIESTSSENGLIKVLSKEKVGNRYQFGLEITPPAQKDKKRFFKDVFYMNIKDGEKLKINCRGFYEKKM